MTNLYSAKCFHHCY